MENRKNKEKQMQLHVDFKQTSSTIVPDCSPNGFTGVIRNYDNGGAVIKQEELYGTSYSVISLPGTKYGGFLEFPSESVSSKEGISILFWCRLFSCEEEQILFSVGQNQLLYLKIRPCEAVETGFYCMPCVSNSGPSQEQMVENRKEMELGRWYQFAVTLGTGNPSLLSFYVDGCFVGSFEQKRINAALLSKEGSLLIGNSKIKNDPVKADIADFKVFQRALEKQELYELFCVSDEECIKADKTWLDQQLPKTVTGDLTLPQNGLYETHFQYDSSKEEVLSKEGIVHRPLPGEKDAVVKFSVLLTHGLASQKVVYTILILAVPSIQELLAEDAKTLSLSTRYHVYQNLDLPTGGKLGSQITWISSDPEVVSPNGEVTIHNLRSEQISVNLTATLHFEGRELTKIFKVSMLPKITRKEVAAVPYIEVETEPGIPPVLPVRIWVMYRDGSKEYVLVTWEAIKPGKLVEEGRFQVKGELAEQFPAKVYAEIIVKAKMEKEQRHIQSLPLEKTKLLGEHVFTQNRERTLFYIKFLDPDRMLHSFRTAYGVDTRNAKPLGGWDEPQSLLRGHSLGHLLSSIALSYAGSKEEMLRDRANYFISELRALQCLSKGDPASFQTKCTNENASQSLWSKDPSTWGEGYLSAYSPDQFALLENYTTYPTIWAPYYTLHKILAGLLDCYRYMRNETALVIACGIGDWVYKRLSTCSQAQRGKMWSLYIAGEYGGINESLAELSIITKKKTYQKAATFFDNRTLLHGCSENKDVITSLHANQHIPQIIGALKEYEIIGERKYFQSAYYFWNLITKHYAYSIGGVGRGENLKEADKLAVHIDSSRNCETCASYNMLKLSHDLYCYDPENPDYMDYLERTLYNHIIASQNPEVTNQMHHGVTYMLPIGPGQHKEYGSDYEEFTCCHGTGMENHVKYQENIYFSDLLFQNVYVNLYLPSTLVMEEQGIHITQTGTFPTEKMTIRIESSELVTCHFRIPNWCRYDFKVTLNAEKVEVRNLATGYLSLTRVWNKGDLIEVELPYQLRLEYTQDQLEMPVASVLYGPFVMVADSSVKDWIMLTLTSDLTKDFRVEWIEGVPFLFYGDLRFLPMYLAHHVDYHTYFKIKIPELPENK